MFFEHADSLVGVAKNVDSLSSEVLTLDLKGYTREADANGEQGAFSAVANVRDDGADESATNASVGKAASPRMLKRRATSSLAGKPDPNPNQS